MNSIVLAALRSIEEEVFLFAKFKDLEALEEFLLSAVVVLCAVFFVHDAYPLGIIQPQNETLEEPFAARHTCPKQTVINHPLNIRLSNGPR